MITQKWVSKIVNITDWRSYYSQAKAYCYLDKTDKGVRVGFVTADDTGWGCEPLTDEEMRRVDIYRQANRVYPLPMGSVEI